MKKTWVLVVSVLLCLSFICTSTAFAGQKGASVVNGTVYYSAGHYLAGQAIPTGYDAYGYNYQAHMFNGSYANAYLGAAGYPPYTGDDESYLAANPGAKSHWAWVYRKYTLKMKWNDAWLSNMDQDGDGKLDRHYGFASYIGSGAWLTNHMSKYFLKASAAPADAVKKDGVWYSASGGEIGPDLWGEFAIIEELDNENNVKYFSPLGPGFGKVYK